MLQLAPNGFPISASGNPASRGTLTGRADFSSDKLILDLDLISQEILAADGNIALVAEKILGSQAKTNQILAAITADAQALDAFSIKARAYAMIKMIGVFSELSVVVMGQISQLNAREAAKALTEVGRVIGELSEKKAAPVTNNNFATFMGALPAPVRQALDVLVEVQPDGTILSRIPENEQPAVEGEFKES